ncbi:glutamyl-tRNA synthetase [Aliarcobacter butzleri RM4018]|uniref:Glutamate--tRNA ligase 1 n=1 Tax=Aliarcobacter butzleri (strain RM4018) TaxID=367737 RepID=SYE1_ALIB4|nr:glutamate--tRNA ligase [Aliarcobacter butzleri]A8EQW9.1 RecName: Full=Glutamate--tRNA ligase 1; AltName: Full=Glutamyl-tRNA synthetase 1; Short=GluRS 1 [Aliarcobacter butzleri RM4018]ABV66343.1 glutamyl-tRNA synthetase [Aliarcobacter butzleri RM4018]GGT76688.1 glutamate--tRNA ligase 2 [Aliarcobacter butzleri]SNV22878.1 Glutamate--tRNA ligase [Aliarcobacter butzleri]
MAITRFAPSPTGYLHIGGLRTSLYSYLWARKTGGEFRLRIEDTDLARNSEEAMKAIIDAFDWVGLNYDGEVFYQSKRTDIYKQYIDKLLESGNAYKCYMSKEELDALRAAQEAAKQTPRYDGTWRPEPGKELPPVPAGVEPVIRIKAPTTGTIEFDDGVKGHMKFDANQVDDYVIARSNGMPTYNFVVAIDDALMGMTDVIRGDDHLSNTPKQIVVYNALGFKVPKFYHVPMINNPEGKKLSKRDGAMDVMDYKRLGYLPEALLNFLVRLGWSNGDQEIFSMKEMLELFDPSNINKSASSYNGEKLLWLNSEYIKAVSNERLIEELKFFDLDLSNYPKKNEILDLAKQRAQTLVELKKSITDIIDIPTSYEESGVKKFIKEDTKELLEKYLLLLESNKNSLDSVEKIEEFTKPFINDNGLKFPQLFQPIRIALTGGTQAPSVYDIIFILGYDEIFKRINEALKRNFQNT